MRIDLLAPPYRGHLHPILAIGRELADGHDVRVVSTPTAASDVRACGLAFAPLLDAAADAELAAIADPPRAVGGHPVRLWRQLRRTLDVLARARTALDALWADDADRPALVIADFTLPIAGPAAAAHGIEWWTALPSPCVLETASGPPAYLGGWARHDDAFGRVRDALARRAVCAFKRGVGRVERARLAALGFDGVYRSDGTEAAYSQVRVLALGLEAFELGTGWPPAVRFIGPYLLDPMPETHPPSFVDGRRHVLVTCGTHLGWAKAELGRAAVAIARALPDVEVHLVEGRPGTEANRSHQSTLTGGESERRHRTRRPENLTRLAWVDYARHVRRYALVVHHAGAGILYRCLADGVPALAWPRDYDQFDNAARLEHAGLARRIDRSDDLVGAVREALADDQLAGRCAATAERLREHGGAVSALVEASERS